MKEISVFKCPCDVCHDGYKSKRGFCRISALIKLEFVSCVDGYTLNGKKSHSRHMIDERRCYNERV